MNTLVAGIGDLVLSSSPEDTLKTYALGSCVAVIVHDPVMRVAGLVHIALPDSSIDPEKALEKPGYFADTGIPLLLARLERLGSRKAHQVVKLAGGAGVLSKQIKSQIGEKNADACRAILSGYSIRIESEDVAGEDARTVEIEVGTGTCRVSSRKGKTAI